MVHTAESYPMMPRYTTVAAPELPADEDSPLEGLPIMPDPKHVPIVKFLLAAKRWLANVGLPEDARCITPVSKFLNRLLGLQMHQQQLLFKPSFVVLSRGSTRCRFIARLEFL